MYLLFFQKSDFEKVPGLKVRKNPALGLVFSRFFHRDPRLCLTFLDNTLAYPPSSVQRISAGYFGSLPGDHEHTMSTGFPGKTSMPQHLKRRITPFPMVFGERFPLSFWLQDSTPGSTSCLVPYLELVVS
jgi:hypothetical protein